MIIYRSIIVMLMLTSVSAASLPKPKGYVSDYMGLLDGQSVGRITQAIQAIEASTNAEIAVIIQDTLGEHGTVEELALAYLSEWKIGKKGVDNGLVLLVVIDQSRKHGQYRFETGLGLEGDLPDGLLGQIGREEMVPYFRQGDYGNGILSAVARIGEILGADMSASRPHKPRTRGLPSLGLILGILAFFVIFGGIGKGGRRGGSGGSGLLWLLLLGSMGGGRQHGGWGSFGGGGFGGGGSGGGFGGFGGGGGGAGGGASGGW